MNVGLGVQVQLCLAKLDQELLRNHQFGKGAVIIHLLLDTGKW